MKDPYHKARLRFKVARDRSIEESLKRDLPRFNEYNRPVLRDEWQRIIRAYGCDWYAAQRVDGYDSPAYKEAVKAAGILDTMLTFKITDEQQALMLWKLNRD